MRRLVSFRVGALGSLFLPLFAGCSSDAPIGTDVGGAAQTQAGAGGGGVGGSMDSGGGGGTSGAAVGGSAGGGVPAGGGAGSAGAQAGGGVGGAAGSGGSGGVAAAIVLPAYTGSAAKPSTNLGTRNAGHQLEVKGGSIVVRDLGIWDNGADGLAASHTVTLFSLDKTGAGAVGTAVPGGSVVVPAGTAAELEAGFRYAALAAPVTLAPGKYAVIAYGLNANDLPGDGGGLPLPATGITDAQFDSYEFVTAASPAFPGGGDANGHANASLRFESQVRPLRIMPLGASITDGFQGTKAGYRGPLRDLLDQAGVVSQFVGSWTDNPGMLPLPREQQHHEGHSGFVIQAGSSGRAGIWDSRVAWLGPSGSPADVILIIIGTNDVDLDYKLDMAGERLEALVTAILDPVTGLQPKAHVVLAQLPPINDAAEDVRCLKYNEAIVATVLAHQQKGEPISTVDLHAVVAKNELADKLHPNDVGYGKVAKAFFDEIQKLDP